MSHNVFSSGRALSFASKHRPWGLRDTGAHSHLEAKSTRASLSAAISIDLKTSTQLIIKLMSFRLASRENITFKAKQSDSEGK